MFETHLDATYAWLGLAVVSVATAGVAATLPASPPPDAAGVAHTIETVAGGEYPATAEHGIAADRIRLTPRSVSLGGDGGDARAPLHAPRVTPVPPVDRSGSGDRLRRVLDGVPPDAAFDDPDALAAAAERARSADSGWRPAPERLTVRRVHYGGVHVTLVG
ncbi:MULTISPECIES: hypothetical protein [unclassified Halorubrum]|uniref:DUF7283 family protein n=1 Tax=unclassified Halorubrum TaxID=2642239 RepID=UPI000B993F8F|nr:MULTISPECIES: hypothetical protein [unclassified Halorubrum]OYR40473.1 hypothetical protein DJ75_15125 [Halorubrum sp. Eb13]OYR46870.1 hypothetical protein DJ81_02085 [Halorubrum sp. Hd13]OYR46894.1 hypothetical protein DJ74_14025 [Halorubrum sp. Ea8]OYR54748.1 hypothetical protein DJ73_04420 [Halorubrum sp. Ea1]